MQVRAADGLQCPKEGKPREYITDDPAGTDVPDTTYYRRLLDDGSLILTLGPDAKVEQKKQRGDA